MGFIDWHGNKEDHFDDLVEFAKLQEEIERERIQEKNIKRTAGEYLRNPDIARMDQDGISRLVQQQGKRLWELHRELTEGNPGMQEFDDTQLFADFWLVMLGEQLARMIPSKTKREKMHQVLMQRFFRIENNTNLSEHAAYLEGRRRYRRYIRGAFETGQGSQMQFWRWIADLGSQKIGIGSRTREDLALQMAKAYGDFITAFSYYLGLMTNQLILWRNVIDDERETYTRLQYMMEKGALSGADLTKLRNPIYEGSGIEEVNFLEELFYVKVILFNRERHKGGENEDMSKADTLYREFKEKILAEQELISIVPEEIGASIREGILPVFPIDLTTIRLHPDETLHYMDHVILFRENESEDADSDYLPMKGCLFVSNERMIFQGSGEKIELKLSQLDRVIQYDVLPRIMEFKTDCESYLFQAADIDQLYRILVLVANKKQEEVERKEVPLSYEELVEKADFGALLFAFQYAGSGDMPEELRTKVHTSIQLIGSLRDTLNKYPDRTYEVQRFLSYYIPEAIRVVTSYQQYQSSGIDQETMQKVYRKVISALDALNGGIEKRITDIYRLATMNTVAQADALKEIIGQDGFQKGNIILKH